MEQETIAAIATPFGSGGIGIIRISGTNATAIAGRLFRRSVSRAAAESKVRIDQYNSHHLTHGYIVNGDQIIDEVLLVVMKAPHSYTREDVVEVQSHSGAIVLNQILKLILSRGARLADPGEFTKRAFLSGRIDLSQAEAVADIIAAKSQAALRISTSQLTGAMKSQVDCFVEHLNHVVAQLQAHLEFSDEIDAVLDLQRLADDLAHHVVIPTKQLVADYNSGHLLRDGVRMDIVGRPNVGKSSLLNRLLQKERAIVTNLPGTTRDLIEDCFSIDGIPILITDTAGLHVTQNPVEIIGIQKTHDNIARSDLVLFVVDGTRPFQEGDLEIFQRIHAKKVILVINKMDMLDRREGLSTPQAYQGVPLVLISALTGEGVGRLKAQIAGLVMGGVEIDPGRILVPNLRQKLAFDLALDALERSIQALSLGVGEELIIDDLEMARNAFFQIIGQSVEKDILDEIFNRFCIGK
jgi:tRNA modification GTPase